MKTSISKETVRYLESMEDMDDNALINLNNSDDESQRLIDAGLAIVGVSCYPEIDLMDVVLNSARVLTKKISCFPTLQKAKTPQLENFTLIANKTGIHWPDLDEDLSLKGLIEDENAGFGKSEAA